MILDVLDRAYVLREATRIYDLLKKPSTTRRSVNAPPGLEPDPEIAKALGAAINNETKSAPSSSRRAVGPAMAHEEPYISGDPIISIVQSALEQYFRSADTPDNVERDSSDLVVSDERIARKRSNRRVFEQFSVTDIGWVSSVVAMGIRNFKNRRPFNEKPADSVTMSDNCRMVVVGDWGTGVPRAQKVAMEMRKFVVDAKDRQIDCHVVHLGDVYYSGFEYEYRERFLPYWPVLPTEAGRIKSWCLNGNHDMYSGGHAFFDYLLADPRFADQQRSSFFRIVNAHWQILGLDTAWDDDGLKDPQAAWVKKQISGSNQKTMLLSHHQLFSARENAPEVGSVLREKLKEALEGGKIDAALWGHEHRCVTYEPYANVNFGRLIGHGGVPVWADSGPLPKPGRFQSTKVTGGGVQEKFAYMGFAVLDFAGPEIEVAYYDENGALDAKETIT